jgi:hypothetical protein
LKSQNHPGFLKNRKIVLHANSKTTEALRIGEEAIERVYDFLYLGSKIDENGGIPLDIHQRINKARGAFSRLKNVW